MKTVVYVLAALLLPLAGTAATAQQGEVLRLMFVESEAGIEPYATRMLVSPEYLRIDDGECSADYILFDRSSRRIYTVTAGTRSIMVIEPRPMDAEPPMELRLTEEDLGAMKGAPEIAGRTPRHYRFGANGKTCYNVVAVEGLMPEAVRALREFRTVLAGDSALTLHLIPADLHDACEMAANTFAPNRHLSHGFPIQEWDEKGYTRSLVDYQTDYRPQPGVFTLPEGYMQYTVQELREGRVNLQ